MIEYNKQDRLNNIFKGLVIIGMFFIITFFKEVPLVLFGIKYDALALTAKELYSASLEIIMILILYLVFENQIKKAWADLKQNHLKYFSENFKYYLLGIILMFSSNFLINLLGGGMSGNETAIRDQFEIAPIFTFISSVILAPLLEEGIFRLGFRNVFKNNFIFILLSGLVFGGLHLLAGASIHLLALYLVSYCSFGVIFAYMLVKTNNIFVSLGFHMMHNGILMSIQMLIFIFG